MASEKRSGGKNKKQDRITIAVFVAGIAVILILIFGSQIKSMIQGIGEGRKTPDLSGTDIIFEVGEKYELEHLKEGVYKISENNGQYVVFAELELQDHQMVIFEDKDGRRHKFYVSGTATYMGPPE